jgi:prepilin-type N-terminal cleavage/methylation domain-containing protein
MLPRAASGRRPGFTLLEVLISLVLATLVMLAGFGLMRGMIRVSGTELQRQIAKSEPQEISDVLEPMLQNAGNGLPVDSLFAGLNVRADSSAIYMISADSASIVATGTVCPGTANCLRLIGYTIPEILGRDSLLVISDANGAALVKAVSAITAGTQVGVTWATTGVLTFPAVGNAIAVNENTVVRSAHLTTITYVPGTSSITVKDPVSDAAGATTPWTLAGNVTAMKALLIYSGRSYAGPPNQGTYRWSNNITGAQLTYTMSYKVGSSPRTLTRIMTVAPGALMQ